MIFILQKGQWELQLVIADWKSGFDLSKARFRRRSTHVPNLTGELSAAKERCTDVCGNNKPL